MQKTILFGSIAILFLLGAACSSTSNNDVNSKPADNSNTTISTTTATNEQTNQNQTGITLTAEATGNQTVKLNWQVTDELKKQATAYALIQGNDSNPTYPGRYWYERGPAHFDFEWTNLPIGKSHIRACVMVNSICTVYSNDLEVDIK